MSVLDGAARIGDVVFLRDELASSSFRRALVMDPEHGAREVLARERTSSGDVELPYRRFDVDVMRGPSPYALFAIADGVSLHEVMRATEENRAELDADTTIFALHRTARALAVDAESVFKQAPYVAAEAVRVTFDGDVVVLAGLPGWPAPHRAPMHAWFGLISLVERIATPLRSTRINDLVRWANDETAKLRRAFRPQVWAELATTIAAIADNLDDVDRARIAGLVAGLFPELRKRSRELTEEIALLTDDELRAIPAATSESAATSRR